MSGLDGLGWPNHEDEPKPKKTMNSQLEIKLAPTPESDKAKIAFTSLFANDDAYWIPYAIGKKLERERDDIRAQLREEQQLHVQTLNERDEAQETIATMEIRHAAVMLHTQSIVDDANQCREQRDRYQESADALVDRLGATQERRINAERERDQFSKTLGEVREILCDALPNENQLTSFMAATLVRERDEWKAKYIQQNEDLGCEMMDPNGTIWDYAKKVQRELTVVTKQRDNFEERLRVELGGHPDSELWGDAGLIAATMRCVDAIDAVTEQRDRLAEALRNLCDRFLGNKSSRDITAKLLEAFKALQSLNQPTEP